MHTNFVRLFGSLLAFTLFSPLGFLFSIEPPQPVALNSPTANWADTEEATTMLTKIQKLAMKVRKEVSPLEAQGLELNWQSHAIRLNEIKSYVNEMSSDLMQLSEMRKKLEPWQQQLLGRMTPNIHELVYQTEAAIKTLNGQHDSAALALTQYPGYLNSIYRNSNQLASSVGTFTEYVHAAQKMAILQQQARTTASS